MYTISQFLIIKFYRASVQPLENLELDIRIRLALDDNASKRTVAKSLLHICRQISKLAAVVLSQNGQATQFEFVPQKAEKRSKALLTINDRERCISFL